MSQPEDNVVCRPEIEECIDEPEFKNTIELDYNTPNLIVGILSIANFVIPVLVYRFWFNLPRSTADQAVYNDQSKYQYGWLVIYEGSKYIWGPPALFWIASRLNGLTAWPFLLLVWWSSFQTYVTPMIIVGAVGAMLWGAIEWDDAWNAAISRGEVVFTALAYLVLGGGSYYLFTQNMAYAILYYDEVLQERHEEVVQFGEPEKEEDLPEEREELDQLSAQQHWQVVDI